MNYLIYPFIVLIVIYVSKKLNLLDFPNKRKVHKKKVPYTGGIAIFIFYMIIISNNELNTQIEYIITIGTLVLLCGFLDDFLKLRPGTKLLLIAIPITYLILNGLLLSDIGRYDSIGLINLGKFAFPFTILSVGLLINAVNYIDGTDGLLLSMILTAFIYLGQISSDNDIKLLLYLLSYPIIINIFFNFLPNSSGYKMFTGNCGSLFFGFLLSFLIIYLYVEKNIHPALLIWAIWYPVFDFLAVNFKRIYKKKNIFEAGKDHFHHFVLKKMKSNHFKSFVILTLLNISIICFGFFTAKFFGNLASIILFVIIFFFYLSYNLKKNFLI